MKNQKVSNWALGGILAIFVAVILGSNFIDTALAQKIANDEKSALFRPLYPYTEDYKAINTAIATKVGIDLTEKCEAKIAIIDSGADVGIAALEGRVDVYRDYTEDNFIKLKKVSLAAGKVVFSNNKRYYLGDLAQKEAVYHLGELDLSKYSALNSLKTYSILSICGNGAKKVYIDTDMDGEFADEKPLGVYEFDHRYASLALEQGVLNIVCTAIRDNGAEVCLSSDYLGHGTFITTLIGGQCSTYQGLALNSHLLVYQIFATDKHTEQKYLAEAINDALLDGAEIINLSLSLPLDGKISAKLEQALDAALAKGVAVLAAGGNYGGYEATLAYPASKDGVLAVGTLITKEGYALGRGINLLDDFVPYYSSRAGSEYTEFLLAPGCAISAMPQWSEAEYMYDEGSSIATAVASACAAHTLKGEHAGDITNKLIAAAVDMGYQWQIEGAGLIQARLGEVEKNALHLYQEGSNLCITNTSNTLYEASFFSAQKWLSVPPATQIAPNGVSIIPIEEHAHPVGEVALIKMSVGSAQKAAAYLCWQSIADSENITQANEWQFDLLAGKSVDYYFAIKDGAGTIEVSLEKLYCADNILPHGRVAVMIYEPNGKLFWQSGFFGASFTGENISRKSLTLSDETNGIWRLSVISSEQLPLYNHLESYGVVKVY